MKKSLFALFCLAAVACTQKEFITDLKCEYVGEPIGIDMPSPRFSWSYTDAVGQDFVEAGYAVDVAECADSLEGSEICPLEPFKKYFWRVTAWNEDKSKVFTSPVSCFETGPMTPAEWTAEWISDSADKELDAAPMLRKQFSLREGIAQARLYMSAAAYAQLSLNGEKASESCLEPGYTAYDKRNLYVSWDVTGKLHPGQNVIAAVLGNGFYNEIRPVGTWGFHTAPWRGRARMIAMLRVCYKDGSVDVIGTDDSWKATHDGPFLSNNIYCGDIYDARREMPGWEKAGFDDSAWENATVVPSPSGNCQSQLMPPIAQVEELKPVGVKNFGDTMYVFDFGRNIAGVSELSARGPEGTKVTLTHSELVKEDGTIEMRNIDCYLIPQPDYHLQCDIYYMKGQGLETWAPSFVYHGFRYVEVKSSAPLKLDSGSLKARYIHSAVDSRGEFSCSNELLNTIWDMARRTYLNNLHSIFTDCPTREKNGWTADNFLTCELALLNFDMVPYFNKWVYDVVDNLREDGRISGIMPDWGWGYDDWIGPVWDSSIFSIAEYLYNFTGDLQPIRTLWPVYKKYLEYLKTREGADGLPTYGIGDWVYLNVATPTEFTTPCFYYKDYCVMSRFAALMGEDPAPYRQKAQEIRNAINAKWFDAANNLYANGSQAAQGVALYLGIVPEGHEQAVADNLDASIKANNGFLEFGSMGSKTVPRMLTRYGHVDTAYGLTTKEECPSWGGWVKQCGFTTLAETWILSPVFKDASVDHAFLGDIAAWYVNDLAGINCDPDTPGFRNVIIRPHFPEGLDSASASYDSVRGRISVSWKRVGSSVSIDAEIPYGCTGELVLNGESQSLHGGRNSVSVNI